MNKKLLKIMCVAGIVLLVIGLMIYGVFPVMPGGPVLSIIGIILIGVYVYINRIELRNSISVRSAKYGTNTIIFIVVIFFILSLLYVLSEKYRFKMDTTIGASNSLTQQTIKILKNLKDPITIYGFINKKEITNRELFKRFCDRYSYFSNGKIFCQLIEPDENPQLARDFLISSTKDSVYGFKSSEKVAKTDHLLEEDFTSAIIRMTRKVEKDVYFTTGHGEGNLYSDEDFEFKKIVIKLKGMGYDVKEIFLPEASEVPDNCSALILLSPKTPLLPTELKKIDTYLNKGGSAFILIDPYNDARLDEFLQNWGLHLNNDLVIDFASNMDGSPLVPLVKGYFNHPLTKVSRGTLAQTFFAEATSMRTIGKKLEHIDVQPLFATTGGYNYSYGEMDSEKYLKENKYEFNNDKDIRGPMPLAFAITKIIRTSVSDDKKNANQSTENINSKEDEKLAKLVVIGDSDFANNLSLDFAGNSPLFMNTVNWLTGDADLISIDRPASKSNVIRLTNSVRRLMYYIFLVLLPGIILFTGLVIWWKKRK